MNVVPPGNLAPDALFDFIVKDFESAWDALASTSTPAQGAGNFMFARQAMSLLELCCRVVSADGSGLTLADFGTSLAAREPRYFTMLPGQVPEPGEFRLPSSPTNNGEPNRQLLWALFDLIRNGQAHFYQQIPAQLNDNTLFAISLTGAEHGRPLATMSHGQRPSQHLALRREPDRIWIVVLTGALFLDLRDAARQARIFEQGLMPAYLRRPRTHGSYDFTAADLLTQFEAGGHPTIIG